MKRIFLYIVGIVAATGLLSCGGDDKTAWETYQEWYEFNTSWMAQQEARTNADGTPYYTKVVPAWDSQAYVLIKYFNDRSKTEGNLSPMYTSTVNVKYKGCLCTDEPFDSSYLMTTYGDSLFQTRPSGVIPGWAIALENMRVGDTCEVVIPFTCGYGEEGSGSSIPPYSALKFGIKLVDIVDYELP